MQTWVIPAISALICSIITAGVVAYFAYLRERSLLDRLHKLEEERLRESQEHEEKLQRQAQACEDDRQFRKYFLEKDVGALYQFVQTEGLTELVNFFKDKTLAGTLLDRVSKLSELDKNFGELKGELESIRGMVSERAFNPVTGKIHSAIEGYRTFAVRLGEYDKSKIYLKDHWMNIETVQNILATEDSIFIESGSTLAYCMLSIMNNIRSYRSRERPPLCVCTNNVAIYMMLLFQEHFDPVLLPGKPDNPYAATFGVRDILADGQHDNEVKQFLEDHKVNALFTTASYLDIDYGPHISSPQNHAMKRILNDYSNDEAGRKNIFVIAAEKINQDVKDMNIDKKCLLIFDADRQDDIPSNPEVLDKVKMAWEEHLRGAKNYILAGSADISLCKSKLNTFVQEHTIRPYTMQPYTLELDGGMLFTLSTN